MNLRFGSFLYGELSAKTSYFPTHPKVSDETEARYLQSSLPSTNGKDKKHRVATSQ